LNELWGDCPKIKEEGSCRMVLQNVNGLTTSYDCEKSYALALESDAIGADIIGMVETNINWRENKLTNKITNAWKERYKHVRMTTSSSDIMFDTPYQPGGTAIIVAPPWTSRATMSKDNSGLGRWTQVTLKGKNNNTVSVITVYGVGKNNISTCGPHTCYFQQWNLLNKGNEDDQIDPRKRLFEDLQTKIEELKGEGEEIIVLMDANDTLQMPNSQLTSWAVKLNLSDVHTTLHGTVDEPATYSRGSSRIDYILSTEGILNYITEAGILPLHELVLSDHRALFIDVNMRAFLGGDPYDIMNINNRNLSTSDPRTVVKYQKLLLEGLENSDIENRVQQINDELQNKGISIAIHEKMEEIDKDITKLKMECERKCKQQHRHPWSPILKQAYRNYQFWTIWISEKKHRKPTRSTNMRNNNEIKSFAAQRKKYSNEELDKYLYECENKIINEKLRAAKRSLQEVRRQAAEHRNKFLELQAEMYHNIGETDKEKVIKTIRTCEWKRKIFRKLRSIMGKSKSGGLDHILKQQLNGESVRISDKEQMYSELINQNRKHFSQADGTPFTTERLHSLIGNTATNDFCDKILDGSINFDYLNENEATLTILKALIKKEDIETINIHISTDDVTSAYKVWNEKTSTSPSTCHLGHEKALLKRVDIQEKEATQLGKEPLYKRIFRLTATKLNWAITYNHTYERWKKVVNALIEKIPGQPFTNKLRVIHLLESDFNMMVGIIWGRRMVFHCENKNLLNDGQYGSRPGRRCQDLLVQKDSTLSIWRMARQDGVLFDNDAKSCFDRIVMTLGSIRSQQLGMPKQACRIFLQTLSNMQYYVKTSFGISENSYTTTSNRTIHGPGQGGRASPCIWLIISSLLLDCVKEKTVGAKFLGAYDTDKEIQQYSTGFVDDITHWFTEHNRSIDDLIENVTNLAQWWEALLNTSGGKLALEKCFLYVIYWKFDNEGRPIITPTDEITKEVELTDSETGENYKIKYKDCSEAHKSLGIMFTPSGCNTEDYQRILKKSCTFAQKIALSNITRTEATTLYTSFYIPSVSYGLCVGGFSRKQCEKIQSNTTQKFLSKMGFNKCTPSAITYANKSIGGIGLRHLWSEQGTQKLCYVLKTIRAHNTTGDMIKLRLQWAQKAAGTSEPILQNPNINIPHLEGEKWITTFREFLSDSEITIVIPEFNKQLKQCYNDIVLMDKAATLKLTKTEMEKINNCRLYLKVTTLSDITTATGKYIKQSAIECREEAMIESNENWPNQVEPGQESKRIWRNFLKVFTHVETLQLDKHLGHWYNNIPSIRTSSEYYYDIDTATAYRKTEVWYKGKGVATRRGYGNILWTTVLQMEDEIIRRLLPADNGNNHNNQTLLTWRRKEKLIAIIAPKTWKEYVNTTTEWDRNIINSCNLKYISFLQLAITTQEIYIISNASDDEGHGYSWVGYINNKIILTGRGKSWGNPITNNRTELIGNLAWRTVILHIMKYSKCTFNCIIQPVTTSKKIQKLLGITNIIHRVQHTLVPDYDILSEITRLDEHLRKINVRIRTTNVLENQNATRHEKMIQTAKKMSEGVAESKTTAKPTDQHKPKCEAFITANGRIITGGEQEISRWIWTEYVAQDYYCKKFKLSINELHQIDWYNLMIARNKMMHNLQTFSTKFMIDWLYTGSRMELMGELVTTCIYCGLEEDNDHLLKCKCGHEAHSALLARYEEFLNKKNTEINLKNTLLQHVELWLNDDISNTKRMETNTKPVEEQTTIGWHNLVKGLWSKQWGEIQRQHEEEIYKQKKDKKIKKLGYSTWTRDNITWWIETAHAAWTNRNQQIHQTEHTENSRQREEVIAQIIQLYAMENEVRQIDKNIFGMSIERRLLQSTRALETWVKHIRERVKESIKLQNAAMQVNQPTIIELIEKQRERISQKKSQTNMATLHELNTEKRTTTGNSNQHQRHSTANTKKNQEHTTNENTQTQQQEAAIETETTKRKMTCNKKIITHKTCPGHDNTDSNSNTSRADRIGRTLN
jgi:hypothetical protein